MIELKYWRDLPKEKKEAYVKDYGPITFEIICKIFKKSII